MVRTTIATIASIKVITLSDSSRLRINLYSLFYERPIFRMQETITFHAIRSPQGEQLVPAREHFFIALPKCRLR